MHIKRVRGARLHRACFRTLALGRPSHSSFDSKTTHKKQIPDFNLCLSSGLSWLEVPAKMGNGKSNWADIYEHL